MCVPEMVLVMRSSLVLPTHHHLHNSESFQAPSPPFSNNHRLYQNLMTEDEEKSGAAKGMKSVRTEIVNPSPGLETPLGHLPHRTSHGDTGRVAKCPKTGRDEKPLGH